MKDTSGHSTSDNLADDTWPSWSQDGTKIAFASKRTGNYQIYAMHADGSGVTRLTQDSSDDTQPAWSPDGSAIAFVSRNDVYVMKPDGSDQKNLTRHPAVESAPAWSPDSRKIAFASNRDGVERSTS